MKTKLFLFVVILIPFDLLTAQEVASTAVKSTSPYFIDASDASGSRAWTKHGFSDSQRESLREVFRWGISNQFVPGASMLIIHGGETIFREGFGVADLETKVPFTVDAPCRIASVTKPHTSTLMAMLVDRGELAWDDPVEKYLPSFSKLDVRDKGKASRSPKVRELLSHTAGFPSNEARRAGQAEYKIDGTLAEAVDDIARAGLVTEPGTTFSYTGIGYMVAGRIAEVVTGKEFGSLMNERLLKPIGATTAVFPSSASEELIAKMPTMYERIERKLVKVDLATRSEARIPFPSPGGGLVSTLDDIGRVLMLHRDHGKCAGKQLIAPATLNELYRPQLATGRNGYGLGFNILHMDSNGVGDRIRHTGASGTFVVIDFKQDLAVVMLSQVPTKQTQPFGDRLMKTITSVFSQPPLHRIAAPSATDLQELFLPTAERLPFVSAHRGGAQKGYPENCLETFEKTLQNTYAIMEIDPRYTKDGAIVLHHDATLERTTTGKGKVSDLTLSELKQLRLKDIEGTVTEFKMPTIDEAIEWARGKTILVLDQKDMSAVDRVKKITEHSAEAHVMLIINNFKDAQTCHALNPNVMMEVMIPNVAKAEEFDKLGIPWRNVVAFVGHNPPEERELYEFIHKKGASCMIGTSRNVDRSILTGKVVDIRQLEPEYRTFLERGADIIETDIPNQLGPMILDRVTISASKQKMLSNK